MKFFVILGLLSTISALPVQVDDPMINEDLFEGDMLDVDINEDRNAITKESKQWPEGIIYYEIDAELSKLAGRIRKAMDHIENSTCLKFIERVKQKDYVYFFQGTGCYSNWGRIGRMQKISLGKGCNPFGTIVHEILHAIGFEHEHNRSDRDDYLIIHWDNINKNSFSAYKKLKPDQNRLLTPFDYNSIMLYGSNAFVKVRGKFGMTDKSGKELKATYHKPGMSASDIKRINILYNCPNA